MSSTSNFPTVDLVRQLRLLAPFAEPAVSVRLPGVVATLEAGEPLAAEQRATLVDAAGELAERGDHFHAAAARDAARR